MKTVILAGGLGTRISEETYLKPKPMIDIGGKPILWHILKIYSAHGINEFLICCGYRGYLIKVYFANYFLHMSDVTFHIMKINIIRKIVPNWAKKMLHQLFFSTPSAKKKKLAEEIREEKRIKKTDALIDNIFKDQELVVLNGPFEGMKYINASNGSALLPKLVGSYEEPIYKWIYHILDEAKYSFIFDVGCAEGYYAIGLCKAKSSPRVCAYDINIQALSNAKELASKNGVLERISFGECFDPKVLDSYRANHPGQKILIFMDVEGAEIDLLNTFDFPSILECDILVELHDCFKANLTDSIVKYFANTHEIELVFDYPWRSGNYSLNGAILTPEELEFMVDEKRPSAMRWMYARRT